MKEQSELKNLIKINVVNGICGDYQVWDYMSMKYMDTFTGEIEAQLSWVSYDHNEGYEDWGIATHPEREKANGYLCKQVYLADFPIIDRPTPPVETKTAEEILHQTFERHNNDPNSKLGIIEIEVEAMEAYHAQFTPSAKSVEVEEAAEIDHHFQSSDHTDPDIASEMIFHCLDDGSLFVETFGYGSWINGNPEYKMYNFSSEQKERLIKLLTK